MVLVRVESKASRDGCGGNRLQTLCLRQMTSGSFHFPVRAGGAGGSHTSSLTKLLRWLLFILYSTFSISLPRAVCSSGLIGRLQQPLLFTLNPADVIGRRSSGPSPNKAQLRCRSRQPRHISFSLVSGMEHRPEGEGR